MKGVFAVIGAIGRVNIFIEMQSRTHLFAKCFLHSPTLSDECSCTCTMRDSSFTAWQRKGDRLNLATQTARQ